MSGSKCAILQALLILGLAISSHAQSGTTSPTKVVGKYGLLSGDKTCPSTIELGGLNAPLSVPHNVVVKNDVTCADGGALAIQPWAAVESQIKAQIQASKMTDAQKLPYQQGIIAAATGLFARGQDSTAYACGAFPSTGAAKQVYTWIDNAQNAYVASAMGSIGSGAKNGDVFMQIWTPPDGFVALTGVPQSTIAIIPPGGCWYGFGAAAKATTAPLTTVTATTTTTTATTNGSSLTTAVVAGGGSTTLKSGASNSSAGAFKKAACFPGSASIRLEDGRTLRMSELSIGDKVNVGGGRFSKVFMFTHKIKDGLHRFVSIQGAKTGVNIRLSGGHYLYVNGDLARAGSVSPGDWIELGDGSKDRVVRVTVVVDSGLFNPQTIDGDIVVDGVRASTYTTAVAPQLAHALLAPMRALYQSCMMSIRFLENGADKNGMVGLVLSSLDMVA
jgi:Hint module